MEKDAKTLLDKYRKGLCTPAEKAVVERWYYQLKDEVQLNENRIDEIGYAIWNQLPLESKVQPRVYKLWPRIAAAAAVLLVAGLGVFFYASYYAPRHPESGRHLDDRRDLLNYANDIAPGKNTATITLADGSTIQLSDAKTGVIIDAASLKYNDGSAVGTGDARHLDHRRDPLNSTGKGSLPGGRDDVKVGMTSVATPRGGTYQITLPDGTKVWLNAASALKFPSTFQGLGNRKVELSGEAYFEVAKDKAHPFIVQTDKQLVEVLGTHFNINSYAYEQETKTTLVEGSVKITSYQSAPSSRGTEGSLGRANSRDLSYSRDDEKVRDKGQSAILKPGEQSVVTTQFLKIIPVDVEVATAWKNGNFLFRNEKLESILNRLAYWYDVEIVYEGKKPTMVMSGIIERKRKLSSVLEMIALTGGAKFRIEGRKVYVEE
nr:FecR family protein [Pedobacter panaciterrae]